MDLVSRSNIDPAGKGKKKLVSILDSSAVIEFNMDMEMFRTEEKYWRVIKMAQQRR